MDDWTKYLPSYCNNDTTPCNYYNHSWYNKYNLGMLEIALEKNEKSLYQPKDKLEARDELIKTYINDDIRSKAYLSLGGSRRRRLSKRRSNKKKSIRRRRR